MKKNLLLAILCMGSMLCTQAQKKIFSNIPSGQKNMTTGQQKDTRTLTNEDINHQMQVAPAVPKIYFPHIRKLNGKSTFGSEKMLDDRNTSYNIEDSKKNKPNQVLNASDPKFRNTSSTTLNGNATKVPMVYKITRDYNDGDGSKPYKGYFILTDAIDEWNPATTYWPTKKDSSFGDQGFFNCKYVKQSFTAQSSTFMNGAVNINGDNLIPGTIYSYEDLSKGNFREYTDGRNPVNIWTPVFVGNSSSPSSNQFLVQEPNGRNIMQGISNLVRTFTVNQAGAKSYQQTIYSDNLADLNMLVSAGGSYGGFSGFGISKINQTQHHIYITFDDVKLLFSVDCDRPANGYFADGKTPVASSPLVVVKNVTYCTRILANLDIATTASTNYDSLHLNYTDGVDEGTIDFSALANNNSISVTGNVMVVGTDINIPIVSARQLANFEQQLSDLFAKSNFKTALPIQYQLSDLDGNLLGIQSLTDDFVDPQCTPEKDCYPLQSAFFTLTTG